MLVKREFSAKTDARTKERTILSHVHDMWRHKKNKLLPFVLMLSSSASSTAIKDVCTQNKGVIIFILILKCLGPQVLS
jgi:hypothetical protein